jgi:hypothetical protein
MRKILAFSDFSTGTLYDLGFLVMAFFFIMLINPFHEKGSKNDPKSDRNNQSTLNYNLSVTVDSANWQCI